MEHAEAQTTNASERYLLGELNAAEADAFEEHYFDCLQCADDLRAGTLLLEGGRKILREEEEPVAPVVAIAAHRARRWVWMPAAAAAVFAVALATPLLLRQRAEPIVALATPTFLEAGTRGTGDPVVVTMTGDQPAVLSFYVPAEPPYARYEVRVVAADGKTVQAMNVSGEAAAKDALSLVLRGLDAGTYHLVISGAEPAGQFREVPGFRFIVKR